MRDTHTENHFSFPTTRWSLVDRAGAGVEAELAALLKRYLPALRAHLVLERKLSADAADDLLQGFTAAKILEQNLLSRANGGRGRFRTFLLSALKNYLTDEARAAAAHKRRPRDGIALSLDEARIIAVDAPAADRFDIEWARQTLADALREVRLECRSAGREDLWELLRLRVIEPALLDMPPISYEQLVSRFGYTSPAQASNALTTAKRMFARVLRSTIAQYALDPAEAEQEIADLRAILARSGRQIGSSDLLETQ